MCLLYLFKVYFCRDKHVACAQHDHRMHDAVWIMLHSALIHKAVAQFTISTSYINTPPLHLRASWGQQGTLNTWILKRKDLLCKRRKLDQKCQTQVFIMKTQFQYVFVSLLLKTEAAGLIVLRTSSCVMNHVLNVLLCSFPALFVFMSMITIALLDSYSQSSYALLRFFMYEFVSVWCRLVAALCSAWMLHLLQFGCFSVNVFPGISAESLSACIIMHRNAAVARLLNLWIFFTIPWRAVLLCHESLWFFGEQMVF